MSRRNGNGKPKRLPSYHKNVLVKSTIDDIKLCEALHTRFLDVTESFQRITGSMLLVPPSIEPDMVRWRQVVHRYRQGDFRHTEAETKSIRTICQWVVDINSAMRNQQPKEIEWKD